MWLQASSNAHASIIGSYTPSACLCLQYAFILEDCPVSFSRVIIAEQHFAVFPDSRNASYTKRHQTLLKNLLHERLDYTTAHALVLTT